MMVIALSSHLTVVLLLLLRLTLSMTVNSILGASQEWRRANCLLAARNKVGAMIIMRLAIGRAQHTLGLD